MAKISNENKGKMLTFFMNGLTPEEVTPKVKLTENSVNSFYNSVLKAFSVETESTTTDTESVTSVDNIDYGKFILALVSNQMSEQLAYYTVFSIMMEEDFNNEQEFEALMQVKINEVHRKSMVHGDGRAVVLNPETTHQTPPIAGQQALPENLQPVTRQPAKPIQYSDTVYTSDGT